MTDNRNQTEHLLNEVMDHIARTGEQPADLRAWSNLLIYCPKDVLADFYQARMARRIDEIRKGER